MFRQLDNRIMSNRISESANHLTEAAVMISVPQCDDVVCNGDMCPVFLDSSAAAHEQLRKAEMLFDILVERLDTKPLLIQLDHLLLRQFQIVAYIKACAPVALSDKQCNGADVRDINDSLGYAEMNFLGKADRFVFPWSLCQATHGSFS